MRISITTLALFLLSAGYIFSQSLQVSGNYSLYYNRTIGLQIKYNQTLFEKGRSRFEIGLNPSIHYAPTVNTEASFEKFQGNHWHYHLSAVGGPRFSLFKKEKWNIGTQFMFTYFYQTMDSQVSNENYQINRSYKNYFHTWSSGVQTTIGRKVSQNYDLVLEYTHLFSSIPNFIGLGIRKKIN